jgi:hypothetical protein
MRLGLSGLIVAVLFISCGAGAGELPEPPEGFTWFVSENQVGTFLRPDGWFVREEGERSDKALFITRENIAEEGRFVTGLSVNMVPRLAARTGHSPTHYARTLLERYHRTAQFTIRSTYSVPEQNSYEGFGLRYSGENDGVITIVNVLLVASNRDDILFILTFEAPEAIWDEQWERGRRMLDLFALGG